MSAAELDTLKTVVVGFGGVTCGGKSTVANSLTDRIANCCVIGQDEYYLPDDHPRWKYDNTDNWDEIEAFDMVKMTTAVEEQSKKYQVVIVEGVLLYEDKKMDLLFDKRYFFTLPYELCKARRDARVYYQNGEPALMPPEYLDTIYWPYYETQLDVIKSRDDIECISSTMSIDEITEKLYLDIKQLIKNSLM